MTETATQYPRKHPLAECEVCPLYEDGAFVPSDGPDDADIVLIGEAPGKKEVSAGKPFTGPSGQLLDVILQNFDIDRARVFITNTCLCRPKGNANPPTAAIRACANRLKEEIRSRDPRVIVPLGNYASKSVLSTTRGITQSRVGPPKESEDYPGVPIVPTFHPAASLYNASSFPDIVSDFEKVKNVLRGGYDVIVSWNPPQLVISDDRTESISLVTDLLSSRREEVAVDIEIGTDKDLDFVHPDQYRLLCVGLSSEPGKAVVLGESAVNSDDVRHHLGQVLEHKKIIAQNGKFDLAGMYSIAPRATLFFDTMLAHYCLDERRGTHDLERLAVEYLGSPSWKQEIARYGMHADAPREVLYKHNGYDASNTYLLWEKFDTLLKAEPELYELHDFLVRTSPTLMQMEMNGVNIDEPLLEEYMTEYGGVIEEARGDLAQMLEIPAYNPNSWQQVQRALRDVFRVNAANTRAETIEKIQDYAARTRKKDLYDFCVKHLRFKKEAKLYGTYIKGARKRLINGRLYPTYLLHGTVTGRTSCNNPNVQNVPRDSRIRRLYIPTSPDNRFVQVDYGQSELRVVCWLARDAYLRDVFSDSTRDIHGEVAERLFGANFTEEQRVRAKTVVFGLNYGREAYSLAAEFGWPLREAERYIAEFFDLIPDVVRWREEVRERVLSGKDLVSPFGRHRRFWLITKENVKDVVKEAWSTLPQATSSDFTLESLNRLREAGLGTANRIFVHDSIVLEVPQEEAVEVGRFVAETMVKTAEEHTKGFPRFQAEIKIGPSWGDLQEVTDG